MKRTYFVVPLFFYLITGCNSSTGPSSEAYQYLPLNTGNRWYYNSNGISDTNSINVTWEVSGQTEINGKQYYELTQQNLTTNYTDTLFYRFNGDILFCLRVNYPEQIIADFSLDLNDTTYWQNDLKVVEKTGDIIKYETPFSTDYGYSITFKKGIGITSMIRNGFVYNKLTLIKSELK